MAGYTVIHRGHVSEAGKLVLADREGFLRAMHGYAGKDVEVVVRRVRAQRSNPQNRYLHGVVIPILAEFCGYDLDAMKDALKWKFLRVPADVAGAPDTVRHTSDLSTAEFAAFIDDVLTFAAADLGVVIPAPNEVEAA